MSASALSFDDFFAFHTASDPDLPSTSVPIKSEASDLGDPACFDFFPTSAQPPPPASSSSCALAASPSGPGHSPDQPLKSETGFAERCFSGGPYTGFPQSHNSNPLTTHQNQQDPSNTAAANGDVDQSLEVYRDLILRHLVTDISSTCNNLHISTDPEEWSSRDAVVWAEEMGRQFQLGEVNVSALALPGRRLVALSRDEFTGACPRTGDTLYAQLQIWKTAADFRRLQDTGASSPPSMVAPTNTTPPQHPRSVPAAIQSDWLWDAPDEASTPPALHHQPLHHHIPPLSASHYGLCVQTGMGMSPYLGKAMNPSLSGSAHYAHLLSPSDSDSGISADLEEDVGLGGGPIRKAMPGQSTGSIHLWQFIRELLDHPDKYAQCVRWIDRAEGIFKIEDSHKLARLWGQRKNRHKMNYDKLSRSLRQYYKKGIIRKTGQRQRLIYQFIPPYHLL